MGRNVVVGCLLFFFFFHAKSGTTYNHRTGWIEILIFALISSLILYAQFHSQKKLVSDEKIFLNKILGIKNFIKFSKKKFEIFFDVFNDFFCFPSKLPSNLPILL